MRRARTAILAALATVAAVAGGLSATPAAPAAERPPTDGDRFVTAGGAARTPAARQVLAGQRRFLVTHPEYAKSGYAASRTLTEVLADLDESRQSTAGAAVSTAAVPCTPWYRIKSNAAGYWYTNDNGTVTATGDGQTERWNQLYAFCQQSTWVNQRVIFSNNRGSYLKPDGNLRLTATGSLDEIGSRIAVWSYNDAASQYFFQFVGVGLYVSVRASTTRNLYVDAEQRLGWELFQLLPA